MSQHTIITGAAGGLGTAVTHAFVQEEQYRVTALTDPRYPEQIEQLQKIGTLTATPLDVLDEAAVKTFAAKHDAPLDALVLLVGGFGMGKITDTTPADVEDMVRLNFISAYRMVHHFWSALTRAEAGKVVLIGGKPALEPATGHNLMAYSLSKGMIFHLAQMLNESGRDSNTQAVVVAPSVIDTAANRAAMPEATFSDWVSPESIANIIIEACRDTALRHQVYHAYANS